MTEPQTIKLEISSKELVEELKREIEVLMAAIHELEDRIETYHLELTDYARE